MESPENVEENLPNKFMSKKNFNSFVSSVLAGLVASTICTIILKVPKITRWVFDLPNVPNCYSTKIPTGNMFKYKWKIKLTPKNDGIMLYPAKDFYILKDSLEHNNLYRIHRINEYASKDFSGFMAKFKNLNQESTISFQTESSDPLQENICENFIIKF